jgi:hypothetical protein
MPLKKTTPLNHLHIEFFSYREKIDTSGPLGCALMTINGAMEETVAQPDHPTRVRRHAARTHGRSPDRRITMSKGVLQQPR